MSFVYIPPAPKATQGKAGLTLTDEKHIDNISSRVNTSQWRRITVPQHAVKVHVIAHGDMTLNLSTKASLSDGLFCGETIESYGVIYHRSITLPSGLTAFYMEWPFYNAPEGFRTPDVYMRFETQES